jgi:hypothetical protein
LFYILHCIKIGFSFTFALKVIAFDFTSSGIVAAALLLDLFHFHAYLIFPLALLKICSFTLPKIWESGRQC